MMKDSPMLRPAAPNELSSRIIHFVQSLRQYFLRRLLLARWKKFPVKKRTSARTEQGFNPRANESVDARELIADLAHAGPINDRTVARCNQPYWLPRFLHGKDFRSSHPRFGTSARSPFVSINAGIPKPCWSRSFLVIKASVTERMRIGKCC